MNRLRLAAGLLIALLALLAGCGGAGPKGPAAPALQTVSFTTLLKGAYSGITDRQAVLITDEAAWQAHWRRHASRQVPVPPAPPFDFSQGSILAVYMGERNSGGNAVEVTGVSQDGDTLWVTVRQTTPGPGAITTQALTQPFHIVKIPRVPAGTKVEVTWQ